MQVTLKDITITNFRSIEELTFSFESRGLNLFTGKRGAGKTSVFESVYWVITGKTLKGEGSSDVLRIGEKNVEVTLTGERDGIAFTITRSLKKLTFTSSELSEIGLGKREVQDQIYCFLNTSERELLNTLIFGQRLGRFSSLPMAEKRKALEAMLELDFIDKMQENLKTLEGDIATKYNNVTTSVDNLTAQRDSQLNTIDVLKGLEDSFYKDKANTLADLERRLSEAQTTLETFVIQDVPTVPDTPIFDTSALTKANSEYVSQKDFVDSLDSKVIRAEIRLEKVEAEKPAEICTHCHQEIPVEDQLSIWQERVDEQVELLKDLQEEWQMEGDKLPELKARLIAAEQVMAAHQREVEKITIQKNDARLIEIANQVALAEKKQAEGFLGGINDLIADAHNKTFDTTTISEAKERVEVLDYELKEAHLKLKELEDESEQLTWLKKELFSSSGLKSFIFDNLLLKLNHYLAGYLSPFGIEARFFIEWSGSRTNFGSEVLHGGILKPYSSLSGGEKSSVDLALALSLFDLLGARKTKFNVLLLDEVLEGLDAEGIEICFDLLRDKAKDLGVYLITHTEIDSSEVTFHEFNIVNGSTKIT